MLTTYYFLCSIDVTTFSALLMFVKMSTLGHSGLPRIRTVQFSLHTREPRANTAASIDYVHTFIIYVHIAFHTAINVVDS